MDFKDLIKEGLNSLKTNKLRTALAILGIVIGIGSVIALISLGEGSKKSIENQIQSLGANLLTVSPQRQRNQNVRGAFGGGTTLTNDDAKAIATSSQISTISKVSPEISQRSQVTTGKSNTNTEVVGATETYDEVHKIEMAQGNFLSSSDINSLSKVAVIGSQVATDLFGESVSPIGKAIRISGQSFTVIGVTKSKGGTGFMNQDDMIYIPLEVAQKQIFGINYLNSIALEAKSADVMTQAQDEVGYLLMARHKITDVSKLDFSIFSQADILNTASSTTSTFTALLSGIAAISLIVGGIGIMNIMLVSVIERTREIGLRKALGAKSSIISNQFLFESIFLTFAGGLIGVLLGIGISFFLSKILSLAFSVSFKAILLSFFVSVFIGIIFGYYPARKASKMEPIEALRYE